MSKLRDLNNIIKLAMLVGRLQEATDDKAFTGSTHFERRKNSLSNAMDRVMGSSSKTEYSRRLLEEEEDVNALLEDLGIRFGRRYDLRNDSRIHETSVKKELITDVEDDEDIDSFAGLLFGRSFVSEKPEIKQYLRTTLRGYIG